MGTGRPLIRPSATFSRVGEKGHDRVTSPAWGSRDTIVSPLPWPGEVERDPPAGLGRVRAEARATACSPSTASPYPVSGLRPPSPASGRRDRIVSPLPWPGEVARDPPAGLGRVRAVTTNHSCTRRDVKHWLKTRRPRGRARRPAATYLRTFSIEHLESRSLLAADIMISEFMASNNRSLLDEDGESPDWLELMNVGVAPVNLQGWHLTDDPDQLDQWSLPSFTLPPGGTLIVFASGKDRDNPTRPLHTNFRMDADGDYLGLTDREGAIVDEFAPQFPPQVTDVSYGVPVRVTRQLLVEPGASAWLHIPRDAALDPLDPSSGELSDSWLDANLPTTAPDWIPVTMGVGYRDRNADPNPDPGSGVLIADSVAEFGPFQNRNGWRYGYWDQTADSDGSYDPASDFTAFSWTGLTTISNFNHWDGSKWDLAADAVPRTELSASAGHPAGRQDGGPVHHVIRRWTSEVTGTILISGELQTAEGGDGTTVRVLVEGQEVYRRSVGDSLLDYQALVQVQSGDRVDFMIDAGPNQDDAGDLTRHTIRIEDITALVGDQGPVPSLADEINTDIEAMLKGQGSSAYLRVPFTPSAGDFDALTLNVKYDDAFVAYLNGQRIASAGLSAEDAPAWNSVAAAERSVAAALATESFDVTSARDLLIAGRENVLMLHAINVDAQDNDLLISAELVATQLELDRTERRYFTTPTPDAENGFGDSRVGPLLLNQGHQPPSPTPDEPLVLTVDVIPSFHDVAQVDLIYRVMYGSEQTVRMSDDGSGDDAAAGDGVFTARLPAGLARAGEMIRWYFRAGHAEPGHPPATVRGSAGHGGILRDDHQRCIPRNQPARLPLVRRLTQRRHDRRRHARLTLLCRRVLRQRPLRSPRPIFQWISDFEEEHGRGPASRPSFSLAR